MLELQRCHLPNWVRLRPRRRPGRHCSPWRRTRSRPVWNTLSEGLTSSARSVSKPPSCWPTTRCGYVWQIAGAGPMACPAGRRPARSGAAAEAVRTYAGIGFGLPGEADDDSSTPAGARRGAAVEPGDPGKRPVCRDKRRLVHAHSVKPDPLEPGGDGLVIYESRRWHPRVQAVGDQEARVAGQGSRPPSGGQASSCPAAGRSTWPNLLGLRPSSRGARSAISTLKSSSCGSTAADERRRRVGRYVSVLLASQADGVQLARHRVPGLQTAGQRESIIVAVPDFPEFAERVREIVWSGL